MRAADYAFFDVPFTAFAHRGGAAYEPNLFRENSMHAFKEAVALGYRYLETDVHATRDGVLLAFHDHVLDRVTDHTGAIADMTFAQVSEARIHGIDPIPRLSELLAEFPDARFNVDAKSPTAVALLVSTIEEYEAHDRVCVAAFGIRRLYELRRRLGWRVPSAASALGIGVNRFVPWVTWALNTPAPVLQMPLSIPVFGRQLTVVTPALVEAVHRAGKKVQIWTVDDSETMERLIDAGVDGIFTDRIDTLKDVLIKRGLWAE
ncbi:MAG TPA: glycerophosphodiester phosphodiesterase family protein [Propionibacteriaceae bacterium]|nr:glycerophosphodiester phosphodiesterase family protein [Propionibacteriaceae bacterium]